MKQVWICDHCDCKIKEDEMGTHEHGCWQNPRFKICYSCNNRIVTTQHEFYEESCAIELDAMDHEAPEDGPCSSWVEKAKK